MKLKRQKNSDNKRKRPNKRELLQRKPDLNLREWLPKRLKRRESRLRKSKKLELKLKNLQK